MKDLSDAQINGSVLQIIKVDRQVFISLRFTAGQRMGDTYKTLKTTKV